MNITSMRARARWILLGLGLAAGLIAAGCSSTASTRTLQATSDPLDVKEGLRIVFIERQLKFNTTNPKFDQAYVQRSVASLSQATRDVLATGLARQGIGTLVLATPAPDDGQLQPDAIQWLRTQRPSWPVVFLMPNGARLQCSPCTMMQSLYVQLNDGAGKSRWSASIEQPTFTGSLTVGEDAAHRHYAEEVLKNLLPQLRGPRPSN